LREKVSPEATDEGLIAGSAARPLTRPASRATLSRKGRGIPASAPPAAHTPHSTTVIPALVAGTPASARKRAASGSPAIRPTFTCGGQRGSRHKGGNDGGWGRRRREL